MNIKIKNILRNILIFLHIDLTKNLKYDRLTKIIIKNGITNHSNCIDVGCHKGEILDLILKYSPEGTHFAFEPIPYLYQDLRKKYKENVQIYPCALSDNKGDSTFQFVKNAPAYSGIKKRRYDISHPDIEEIKVELNILDDIIPDDVKTHFIKIDIEGGEFSMMKGAKRILKRDKPLVIFESGKGASDFYGTKPEDLYDFLFTTIGLNIYTLNSFIKKLKPMTSQDFCYYFNTNKEYYFIASPITY